jgi:hypothetical protein
MKSPLASMNGPGAGMRSPVAGTNSPLAGMNGPGAGVRSPVAGMNGPGTGMKSPLAGMNGPGAGMNSPLAGMNGPLADICTSGARGRRHVGGEREHGTAGPAALKIHATREDPDGLRCLAAGLQCPVRRARLEGRGGKACRPVDDRPVERAATDGRTGLCA